MSPGLIGLLLTGAVLASFIGGLRRGITVLILVRPLCDRVFEQGRMDIGGHELSCGAILNFIVIGAMLIGLLRIDNKVQVKLERAWLPFLLIAMLAVAYSPVQLDAFRKFLTYVSYMAMFILPFALVRRRATAEYFFKVMILSSVLPVAYGLFQAVSGIDYTGGRIQSTFTHPNIFAFYLLTTIGLIFSLLASNRAQLSPKARQLLTLYLLPLMVLLVMTKTRSAWAGFMVLLLAYGMVQDKRVLVMALVLPVIALFIPAVRDRIMALSSGNQYVGWVETVNPYAWRQILWTKALPMILQRPVLGHGLYSFPYYSPSFFPLEAQRGVDAHNVYVQLLFETGFAGLLSYLWIFWRKFALLLRYWALDRRALAMVATMTGVYLITCYSDNLLEYVSYGWFYWFTVGLIFADLSHYRVAARAAAPRLPDFRAAQAAGAGGA
jgi:O-antigen ligase